MIKNSKFWKKEPKKLSFILQVWGICLAKRYNFINPCDCIDAIRKSDVRMHVENDEACFFKYFFNIDLKLYKNCHF